MRGKKKKGKGKGKGKGKMEWEQTSLGRYFVETKHSKNQRLPDHPYEEVLVVVEMIEGFERVEEVELTLDCDGEHERRFVVKFWAKTKG